MNAANANLLNSVMLIAMGIWGYMATDSKTALIPVIFGVVLIVLTNSIRNHNKIVAHIAVVLTLIVLGSLIGMRLPTSLDQGGPGLYRVLAMIITGIIALIYFIKSFIDARRKR